MKRPFARYFALFILLIFIINTTCYYLYFDLGEIKAKLSAAAGLFNSERETFTISLQEFERQQDKSEIWYNGKLYDIVDSKIVDEEVTITVYNDKDEETLLHNNTEHFQQSSDLTSKSTSNSLTSKHVIVDDSNKILPRLLSVVYHCVSFKAPNHPSPEFCISTHALSVFTPPPDHTRL